MSRQLVLSVLVCILLASTALQTSSAANALAETLDETARAGAIEPKAAPMVGPTLVAKTLESGVFSDFRSNDFGPWLPLRDSGDTDAVRFDRIVSRVFLSSYTNRIYLLNQTFRC